MASGDSKQRRRRRVEWQTAVPRLIPGAECCPGAIDEYVDALRSEKKASDAILLNVRKHLLYSGWKIDFAGGDDVIKLRYSSPNGRSFYSLPQVCASFDHGCHALESTPPVPKRPKISLAPSKKPISFPLSEKSRVSDDKPTESLTPNDEVIIEPKYCPESVSDYCLRSTENGWKPGAMKAKQHLSAIGWSFYYTLKGGNKRELRYSSPNGRVFASLLTACKWSLRADSPTFSDVSGKLGKAHENRAGTEVKSCCHVNGEVDFELEGKSVVSEIRRGEEQMEETDFIELDSTWWIDELLLSG